MVPGQRREEVEKGGVAEESEARGQGDGESRARSASSSFIKRVLLTALTCANRLTYPLTYPTARRDGGEVSELSVTRLSVGCRVELTDFGRPCLLEACAVYKHRVSVAWSPP